MDAHTARCLQLSTSINMPYHQQYRRNAIAAESMNRSRFPVNSPAPPMRPTPRRSSTAPVEWMPTNNTVIQPQHHQQQQQQHQHQHQHQHHQQPFTPLTGPLGTFSPQFYHDSPTPGFDGSFYPTQEMDLSLKTAGLGMHFLNNDSDFGNMTFSATTETFDDLIRLSETESSWLNSSPLSPDRQSISSSSTSSSCDAPLELPDLDTTSTLQHEEFVNSIELPTLAENVSTTTFQNNRRARSMSRPPAARSSSNRRFRRTPYTVDHTRSSSVMSHSSTMSYQPISMPGTQCCTPVTECEDSFVFGNYQAEPMFDSRQSMEPFFSIEEPMIAPKPTYSYDPFFLNSNQFDDSCFDAPSAMVLPSSGTQNDNCHAGGFPDHGDYADEPDLFGALSEEQSVPSEEDMNPEDPDMVPQEQEIRFEGDLYTPRFVRGQGNKREGYCGLCKPGRWLVLKNSAFWYDKSFTHGISAATGQPFDAPKETRRTNGNPDWEGLCGTCDEWIALTSNKKKGTTWFRHAYKCHNHQKSKDTPKKRRETITSRAQSKTRSPHIKQEPKVSSSARLVKSEYPQQYQQNMANGLQTISAVI